MKEYGCKQVPGKTTDYMLYYVMQQNEPSKAFVAVVGVDCKNKHYKYFSCTDMQNEKPLYTTNKTEVKKWLRNVFGAAVAAHTIIMERVPVPTERTILQLLLQHADKSNADPNVVARIHLLCKEHQVKRRRTESCKPKGSKALQQKSATNESAEQQAMKVWDAAPKEELQQSTEVKEMLCAPLAVAMAEAKASDEPKHNDAHLQSPDVSTGTEWPGDADLPEPAKLDDPSKMQGWTRWMEVDNRQDSGGWCRRLLLLDDSMPDRQLVAITAVEVDAKNKTFFYQATEELGAHCFKSRSEAIAWISKHFITSCQYEPSSEPKHKQPAPQANTPNSSSSERSRSKGARRAQATFACDLDLLHWALDQPSAAMLYWAAEATSELAQHSVGAKVHYKEGFSFEEQLPELYKLLAELASPRVGLMLLAQCSDLPVAVMNLQTHPEPDVAQRAQELVTSWETRSAEVETLTTQAIQEGKQVPG